MTLLGWTQILVFCAIVVALVKPLGGYMTRLFSGERTQLSPVLDRGGRNRQAAADDNDVAKYFAIIAAMFLAFYPQLQALNIMNLAKSAILSAIIFNALIIIALIPLSLKGVAYRPIGARPLLHRNLLIYGVGGILLPFIGIKAIDVLVTALHLA